MENRISSNLNVSSLRTSPKEEAEAIKTLVELQQVGIRVLDQSQAPAPSKNATPVRVVNNVKIFEKQIQNHKFKWCDHCNRWSTTHNTSTHTGGGQANSGSDKTNPDAQANLGLIPDPSFRTARCIPILPRCNKNPPLVVPVSLMVVPLCPLVVPSVDKFPLGSCVHSFFLGLFTLQFMFSAYTYHVSIITNLNSLVSLIFTNFICLRALTFGDLLDFGGLFAAPAIWLSLLFLSLRGQSILSSATPHDPRFHPPDPFIPDLLPARHLKDQARRRALCHQHKRDVPHTSQFCCLHLAQCWHASQRRPAPHGIFLEGERCCTV